MLVGRLRSSWLAAAALSLLVGSSTARAADPEEAQYNAVVALYNAGQWQAAISKIDERERLNLPEAMRSKYLYARGLAYERGNKPAEARAAYEQLTSRFPNSLEDHTAQVAILYLDYGNGRGDAVIAGYDKLDKNRLNAADKKNLALMYAESLYAKADPRTLAAYQAAVSLGADPAPLAAKLFTLRLRQGQHAELLAQSAHGVAGVEPDMVALVRAEALLALGRYAEVDAEASKVPPQSAHHARASFARAQALLKLGKLKEALAPLQLAIENLKDPPVPLAARLALAECLLEGGRASDVAPVLAQVETALAALPEAERTKVRRQLAALRVRSAAASKDPRAIVQAVGQARDQLPPDQLPKILYMRLFALSEQRDQAGVLQTMKDDYPIFQKAEEDGPATMIYYNALRGLGRAAEGTPLLEGLIARKPDRPEALRARLVLASAAMDKSDYQKAKPLLEAISASPKAREALGAEALQEAMFNRALVLEKLGERPQSIQALTALLAQKPSAEVERQSLALLGQAYAVQKDYANAARVWKQALAEKKFSEEADLRERLGRVLFTAADYSGASEQFAALEKLAGRDKLGRDSREMWARAQLSLNKFPEAAAAYEALFESHRDCAAYAYECAFAWDRAKRPAEAIHWYTEAHQQKDKLPAPYAAVVDSNLATLALEQGQGDLGLPIWLEKLQLAKDEASFEAAAGAMRKIAAAGKLDATACGALESAMNAAPADQSRRYTLGAMLLASWMQDKQHRAQAAKLADKLAAELAENEKKLNPKSSGATLGAAMIYYYKGEGQRMAGLHADALAAYETVLAAYPYNQWPDAAACGAAECYLALGDADTAKQKFREVAEAKPADPASTTWQNLAKTRLRELEKGK